jgi:hypothetical protein
MTEKELKILDEIKSYPFGPPDCVCMDLERVCVDLSKCFILDKIENVPTPRDVYNLLLDLIFDHELYKDNKDWVTFEDITNWSEFLRDYYPNKTRTLVYFGALLFTWNEWVFFIGKELLNIPRSEDNRMYNYWIDADWIFVSAFFKRFSDSMYDGMKLADFENMRNHGFSLYESLFRTSTGGSLEKVQSDLKRMANEINEVSAEIKENVDKGHYQEAVTSVESVVNYRLGFFLESYGEKVRGLSFHKLLKKACENKPDSCDSDLIEKLNVWRKKRNEAVHNRLPRNSRSKKIDSDTYRALLKEVAIEGLSLSEELNNWCINFIYEKVKES